MKATKKFRKRMIIKNLQCAFLGILQPFDNSKQRDADWLASIQFANWLLKIG